MTAIKISVCTETSKYSWQHADVEGDQPANFQSEQNPDAHSIQRNRV